MRTLQKGKLYQIDGSTAYYCGLADTNGQICDCCGRETQEAHNFKIPFNNADYDGVVNGAFSEQINIGKTCINKIQINEI